MNSDRIEEIQKETAYPDSISVQQALMKVWNECTKEIKQKPKQKIIDLTMMVGSDIDMEFGDSLNVNDLGFTTIDKLAEDNTAKHGLYITKRRLKGFEQCRIRQDHWHHWNGGECPLPEGLNIKVKFRDGHESIENMFYLNINNWFHDNRIKGNEIIAFKVLRTDYFSIYEWEKA